MKSPLVAALVGVLVLAPATAFAQDPAGLTCDPVQVPQQSVVTCTVRGLAPDSQFSWSASLPGDVLVEEAGTAAADGTGAFQFGSGTATGSYLASVTGTAADGAPFAAEVAGTVIAAAPAGAVSAGFGPDAGTAALIAVLFVAALGLTAFAVRPSMARGRP